MPGLSLVEAPVRPGRRVRPLVGSSAQPPPCVLGAVDDSCHGWTNTIVAGGSVPIVQSMSCTYNVPDLPTQTSAQNPEVLYLYCQIVGQGSEAAAFGQLAPQIAFGEKFDTCGRPRPYAPQWYMQAMYFWRAADGTGDCLGGDWVMTTTFATLPDTPVAASALQMVSVGRQTNPTRVTCSASVCTWTAPA